MPHLRVPPSAEFYMIEDNSETSLVSEIGTKVFLRDSISDKIIHKRVQFSGHVGYK